MADWDSNMYYGGMEMEEDEQGYMGDEGMWEYGRIPFHQLLDQCLLAIPPQTVSMLAPLLMLCFITKFTCSFSYGDSEEVGIPKSMCHVFSIICGFLALHLFFQETLVFIIILSLLTYSALYLSYHRGPHLCGVSVAVVTVIYLLTCELFIVNEKGWHKIRGSQMVLSMKVISVAFDVSQGALAAPPNLLQYLGYLLHAGSIIFGPWVSYAEYQNVLKQNDRKMNFRWLWKVVLSFGLSMLCVELSSCIVPWYIMDSYWIWCVAYRDAQSFRFSHYFVSFLSELTLTVSGLGATPAAEGTEVKWDFSVARVLHIEIPRSLVEVVTNWNMPMHYWLKTYVFKTARPLGSFAAILLTYAASALLHGLNFQLAAVLLSLGFYSFVEYQLRKKLSRIFDACIQAKHCRGDCKHSYEAGHPAAVVCNLAFGVLSVFHLAYLGLMFDSSSQEEEGYTMAHTLGKWSELGFASHWVALATYIIYAVI